MKYTVTINEKSKSVTVVLADGTKGYAKCHEGDAFNITTGIELALERAKVAQATAEAERIAKKKAKEVCGNSSMATRMSVTILIKELEKALPEGSMVIVGNAPSPTEDNIEMLKSIVHQYSEGGCHCGCSCCDEDGRMYTEDEVEDIKSEAYDEGYDDGYESGKSDGYSEGYDVAAECGLSEEDVETLADRIRNLILDTLD